MKITQLLKKQSVLLDAKPQNKQEAIDILVDLMDKSGNLKDKEIYKQSVIKREQEGTTGIGGYIAIPHGRSSAVKDAGISAMVVKDGVDYEAMDSDVSKLFFLIAVSEDAPNTHLDVLAKLSTMLMDEEFKDKLIDAKNEDEFFALIDEKENYNENKEENLNKKYQILAVTACPTGIAHTYMAAESLENKAKQMGVTIKVETNGSGGAKNVLTKEEIENADAIIIAADTEVAMARFNGKNIIKVKVADGIHKSEELINRAINKQGVNYTHTQDSSSQSQIQDDESIGRKIYKHLMSGVSNMLPFVTGGGILIAIAFLLDDYSINPASYGSNTPLASMFMTIGATSFGFMLPILAGFIAYSIGDRPALAVGFIGGALAKEGNSGFLGALVAGFVAGYLIILIKKLTANLPKSFEGTKPVLIYPLIGILIMGIIMIFVINPIVSTINIAMTNGLNSMNNSGKIMLGIILGAMMAVDMGGPINKAAYVFGTASLANGSSEIMAAVMAGGMVPPLAIALSTIFFKNRYTQRERQAGITNIIMGFSFITEGAIPFAAADPARVLPSCIVGSSIAGALSMIFGCSIRAPHGGIWVIGVIQNPLGYIIALLIGSVAGMLMLSLLKKKIVENN